VCDDRQQRIYPREKSKTKNVPFIDNHTHFIMLLSDKLFTAALKACVYNKMSIICEASAELVSLHGPPKFFVVFLPEETWSDIYKMELVMLREFLLQQMRQQQTGRGYTQGKLPPYTPGGAEFLFLPTVAMMSAAIWKKGLRLDDTLLEAVQAWESADEVLAIVMNGGCNVACYNGEYIRSAVIHPEQAEPPDCKLIKRGKHGLDLDSAVLLSMQMPSTLNKISMQHSMLAGIVTACSGCSSTNLSHPLKTCSSCGTVAYCGRNCQKSHWKQHKQQCRAQRT
jgi:hypothetical protein